MRPGSRILVGAPEIRARRLRHREGPTRKVLAGNQFEMVAEIELLAAPRRKPASREAVSGLREDDRHPSRFTRQGDRRPRSVASDVGTTSSWTTGCGTRCMKIRICG